MKPLFLTTLLLLGGIFQNLHAQAPEIEWTSTYGGSGSEGGGEMIENTDGDYFFACTSSSNPSEQRTAPKKGYRDIWVVKTKPDGTKVWDKSYGSGDITLTAMVATSDGGFIAGGNTPSAGIGYDKTDTARGKMDIWIIKVDRNGTKVWDKTLGGSLDDFLGTIIVAPDGNILVAINTSSLISGDKTAIGFGKTDCWVVKLNGSGQKIWDKTYGGSGFEDFYTGLVDNEGNYLFGGISTSPISGTKTDSSRGGNDGWLVKTDANGNKIWDKTLGGDETDYIQCMAMSNNGEYILGIISTSDISGDKLSDGYGANDCWLLKINKSGGISWQKSIGGSGGDNILSIQIDKDNGMCLGFQSNSGISGDKTSPFVGPSSDIWIVKTDANGVIEWQSSYEYAGLSTAKLTADGSYVITGGRNALYLIKLKSTVNTGVFNKYEISTLSIYPNPSINQLSLQIEEKQNIDSKIEIYDIEGKRRMQEKITFENGKSKVLFDLNNGVYFIKVLLPHKIYSQKFVVSK